MIIYSYFFNCGLFFSGIDLLNTLDYELNSREIRQLLEENNGTTETLT